MRIITRIKRQRVLERPTFDHFLQLWFNYHMVFFHYLISRGLKLRAFNFFLKIKQGLKISEDFDPSFTFLISLLNVTPSLNVSSFSRLNNTLEIPLPVTYWKKIILACTWVIKLLKKTERVYSVDKIVDILVLALYEDGLAFNKKEDVYFSAIVNRHLLRNSFFLR